PRNSGDRRRVRESGRAICRSCPIAIAVGGRAVVRTLVGRTFSGAKSESAGSRACDARRKETLRFALAQTADRRGDFCRANLEDVRSRLSPSGFWRAAETLYRSLSPA